MNLKQLISEILINKGIINESDCNCGPIKRNKAPILNESLAPREILSEGLKYHIDNNKPLIEQTYRAGSTNYFNLWAEARSLYTRGILDFFGDDLTILTETHLGEFGLYEGKKVPLDFPMEEMKEELEIGDIITINPDSFPSFEFPYGTKGEIIDINKADYASDDLVYTVKIKYIDGQGDEDNTLYIEKSYQYLDEAKKTEKKDPPLNKPKRGGAKKFYVYVRDPKTKNIKKVSFGAPGMSVGLRDPKRRQAFAKRHDCKNKKDRTKASYWSCNVGRYAKQLGLGKNFYGYW